MFGPDTSSQSASLVADGLAAFLVDRLVEELALLWERERTRSGAGARTGPGLAAQLEAVDGVLGTLRAGRLPGGLELRLLLHAYSGHPAYDPRWACA